MKSLTGTQTGENLAKAFAGESQARNRYTFYSNVAEKEGHIHIARTFTETADNERAHAFIFFNHMIQGYGTTKIQVNADYPIGLGTSIDNLKYGAEGEKEEWGTAYPNFADIAKQEGFPEVEFSFRKIIEIEKAHEKRYLDLLERLNNGTLYKSDKSEYWKCVNCGYIHFGEEAPKVCPACKYPQGWFELMYDTPANL